MAVVLVVAGHCIQFGQGEAVLQDRTFFDDWAFRGIYSFHMPLFALISGWLFGASIERHGLSAQMLLHRCLSLVAVNFALVLRAESMCKGAIAA
ncbi:acyltransferase family protein [Collinsella intestinalis]|uniref:acyltransferase family protein n=1 Tax=Collinsella intestinalis TaxID=147207 RepID=UPI0012611E49